MSWLRAWRRTPVRARPVAWLLQETHVSTDEEVTRLKESWQRLWGRHNNQDAPQLSYWSVNASKVGGVAILLNPDHAELAKPWNIAEWSARAIAVRVAGQLLVNVYAPNAPTERESFFNRIRGWNWPKDEVVLAGDFNCVQSPPLDRMGGRRSPKPESRALRDLITDLDLEDAVTLEGEAGTDDADPDPTEFYTYWGAGSASRIDRFYVPSAWTADIQWVEVREPEAQSDHQCVCLHLQHDRIQPKQGNRSTRRVTYPIRTSRHTVLQRELMKELIEQGVGYQVTSKSWDHAAEACVRSIRIIQKRERKRRKRMKQRLKAQNWAHLLTRRDFLQANVEDAREEQLVRLGQRLERTMDQLRWNFKRVSNWEKDQSIAEIHHLHGDRFHREMKIADKFGSEWKPILGVVHSTVPPNRLQEEFDKFVHIPGDRQITPQQNGELMAEITIDEVLGAIAELNRHKAAGPDGLNNDFFKDVQPVLAPAMVVIGNELLAGAEPPPSFLVGLIIPLRKKGDSVDAMDFRPISLLQTAYKVFMKVMAGRMQKVIGKPIGDSQQGFVHGRQMMKTVMMMLAVTATARGEPELSALLSRVILLLDFRKAYDTVSREFLFLALLKFGFSVEFVNLLRRLHDGTTARFLVNGELSESQAVVSGIRQGCPVAPLLFIIAAEVLALAMKQDTTLEGLEVPGTGGQRHLFSAFVDDSTVFLQHAHQIPKVMNIVERFGQLSGLQVQPAKSQLIFLNKAIEEHQFFGLPVLRRGDTVRYLGYQVGTGPLTDINWAGRIRNIQRRLATATKLGTSIDHRITILNVIMLPSVLFTAAAFDMPKWADKQLRNLQKQFLWRHATATESTRHKVAPGLVFAPKQAGGMGLVSIPVACKTQRVKQTILWLVQRKDSYWQAWKHWMFRGTSLAWENTLTPRNKLTRPLHSAGVSPGDKLHQLVSECFQPTAELEGEAILEYQIALNELELESISWTAAGTWIIELPWELGCTQREMSTQEELYWPAYTWNDNPWIVDNVGRTLSTKKFNRIQPCTLEELQITRISSKTYSLNIPVAGEEEHQQAKLRRWGLAILMNAPALPMGATLAITKELTLRHPPELENEYRWEWQPDGLAIGTVVVGSAAGASITLEQQSNGLAWTPVGADYGGEGTSADIRVLQALGAAGKVVFYAHPSVHSCPWNVQENIANNHVLKALKQQPFKRYRNEVEQLQRPVERLHEVVAGSTWQRAAMHQTPKQVWAHRNQLTEYQVWVAYRVAVRQLNLYHEGKKHDSSCRKLAACQGQKETMEHIFWECSCAQACWVKLIQQWTGEAWEPQNIENFLLSCANRKSPPVSPSLVEKMQKTYPDDIKHIILEWKRIWHILCTICLTSLWTQRNRVVFQQAQVTEDSSATEFWGTAMRQLRALGKRECRQPETQLRGTHLLLCLRVLEQKPREHPRQRVSPVQPPDSQEEPALLTRLRKYQTASRR